MSRREDILKATLEADRLHKEFDTRARAEGGEGRIDVFDMLVTRDVPVMFRPLKNLLGAFVDNPDKGIIVTSQRRLPIQRFTAAHELGHEVLGHTTSLDDEEVLTRALFSADASFDPVEIQANAFASQLLTPAWLIAHHMRRQGWNRESLTDPVLVYQLSLRMGSSYSATCYALQSSGVIDSKACTALLRVDRKAVKRSLIRPYEPTTWYGDVWLVTDRDNGMVIEGSRSDFVVLKFEEHASSGYLWQFSDLAAAGLAIRGDGRTASADKEHFGGVVFRTVIAEPEQESGASGHLHLREVRPWLATAEPLHALELGVELSGPVPEGRLPAQREAMLQVA